MWNEIKKWVNTFFYTYIISFSIYHYIIMVLDLVLYNKQFILLDVILSQRVCVLYISRNLRQDLLM